MTQKTLVLIFLNQSGSPVRVSIDNVKDDITDQEVRDAMEVIIGKNIFDSNGGDLVAIEGAEIVTRTVQELTVK